MTRKPGRSRDRSSIVPSGPANKPRKAANVVTLGDVARVAGVSAQTVSCVINNSGSVSQGVREQVRRIADELGYYPNKSAKTMRTGRSQTLGLVVSNIRQPFFPELAQAVQAAAREAGYALLLVDSEGSPSDVAQHIATLKSHAVEGVISTENIAPVHFLGVPTVIVGDPVPGMDSIRADDVAGGTMLAQHLLKHGHRRIGLVSSPRSGCIPIRRKAFLESIGHAAEIAWELYTPTSEVVTDEITDKLVRQEATAVVCSHDLIAIGVLRSLRGRGLHVPSDVSVVGFDDIPWASIVTPTLTTVRQPYSAMGKGAINLLLDRIANPERRSRRVKLAVTLIERETVGPPGVVDRRPRFANEAGEFTLTP